jgi:hypothetical protein
VARSLTLDDHCTGAADVVQNTLDDGVALLNLRTGDCCEVDGVGAEIWSLLKRGTSLRAVAAHLATSYDVALPRIESDVLDLAKTLYDLGMLVEESTRTDA